mgnify:CR=1 FL=1
MVEGEFQNLGVKKFENGFAYVEKNGKSGYIDKNGKIIVPLEYDCTSNGYYF